MKLTSGLRTQEHYVIGLRLNFTDKSHLDIICDHVDIGESRSISRVIIQLYRVG